MPSAVKIAVTVPAQLYKAVESARKQHGRTRSAVVQEALRHWLRQQAQAALVREYEHGYQRKPEMKREIDAAIVTTIGVFDDDESDW